MGVDATLNPLPTMRPWLGALVTLVAVLAGVKVLVWWLEPRMAFFPWRGVQETPASYGVTFSDHTITTADGETVHAGGWSTRHRARRSIYWHGNGGNLSLWLDVLADIHERGFSVLAVDYRGYGDSTGRPSEHGLYRDGDAATRVLQRSSATSGVPVALLGPLARLRRGVL